MQSTVITIEKGAKGTLGVQGKKAYCFIVEADVIVTETNAFDPTYRVGQTNKEITVYRDGLPYARVKYKRSSGKWSTSFLFDDALSLRLQLHVQSYASLNDYLCSVKPTNMFIGRLRISHRAILSYKLYHVPSENGTLLATPDFSTLVFMFDENITHEEATHVVGLQDDQGNVFQTRQLLLLKGEADSSLDDCIGLYQLHLYQELKNERIDPFSTLCDTHGIVIRLLGEEEWAATVLHRNRYDQPQIHNQSRFK